MLQFNHFDSFPGNVTIQISWFSLFMIQILYDGSLFEHVTILSYDSFVAIDTITYVNSIINPVTINFASSLPHNVTILAADSLLTHDTNLI